MTKILCISDLHPDVTTLGVSRFGEVERAFFQAVDFALDRDNEIDVFLFLGDLVDPDSGGMTMKAIGMMISGVMRLTSRHILTILLSGNHDCIDDGTGATTLTPLQCLARHEETYLRVLEEPGLAYLDTDLWLLGLPYTSVARGVDVAEATKKLWPKDGRVIVASHLSIPGIVAGEETNEMPRGREISYPFEETKRAILRLSGHYHRRQKFDPVDGGPPIRVVGSAARLTFGEEKYEPGFFVLEV